MGIQEMDRKKVREKLDRKINKVKMDIRIDGVQFYELSR